MRRLGRLMIVIGSFLSSTCLAEGQAAVTALTQEIRAHTPANWLVRVRWRDNQLLASITPLPYDTAFKLWYEPEQLHDLLVGLCPNLKEIVWTLIGADQDVVLEPTVGGKSGTEARVNCRAALQSTHS